MDKIDKDNFFSSGVIWGVQCSAPAVCDDLALLSSNKSDFQYALDWFFDACLDAGMKISTPKTKIMCMSRHPVQCYFQTFQQTEKFKCLGITFSSGGTERSTGHPYCKSKCSNAPALPIGCT